MSDLARRAVACAAWKWLPGMLAGYPGDNEVRGRVADGDMQVEWTGFDPLFEDPATLGCLAALASDAIAQIEDEAARDALFSMVEDGLKHIAWGNTTNGVEFLVAALEAAPAKTG